MREVASDLSAEVNRLRLKGLNEARRQQTSFQRLSDYKRFSMAISTLDIPRLRQLLSVSIRQGVSTSAIIERIRNATDGIYHPRGYSERELDTAYLSAALGGPRLAYLLNHSNDHAFPSLRTVRRRNRVPELHPCISSPESSEISENISMFFGVEAMPTAPQKSGHCLMIDGIAVEERAAYYRETNEIVGLCREHSGDLDLHVVSLDAVRQISAALNKEKPTCHYGKECTVAAIGALRATDYHAIPVFVSPTCKTEKAEAMVKWIITILAAWRTNLDGLARHGPIWYIGTDGDGTFRRAKFALLMTMELVVSSPLYKDLRRLRGMNLYTGEDEITATADFKHIFKRFATLMRSSEGILVKETIINQDCLARNLVKLPGMSAQRVADLIDPADHQNVPKAVKLLQSVIALKTRDSCTFNPSELKAHHRLSLLGEVLNGYLEPFINLDLSLAIQLRLLSRYAHLACIMYRRHRTSFMTSQLYIDSQISVKNIYFCVKKQQIADSSQPFYIIHDGTDRLEMSFCEVRTQDHARNFDSLNLARKLSISSNTSALMLKHPELNRGHRRIKLTSNAGPDHANPASTRGDLVVGNVSLLTCWDQGREDAEKILASYGIPNINFDELWGAPDVDLLRPLGDKKYIGVQPFDLDDRSDLDGHPTLAPSLVPVPSPPAADESDGLTIELEDLIATEVMDKHTAASDWVEVEHQDGKLEFYHKSSLVRIALLKSDGGRLMIDRQLRSRGVKRDRFRHTAELTGEMTDSAMFYTGDIGAGLVRCGAYLALAIVEVTSLSVKGQRIGEVAVDSLGKTNTALTVTGQVLEVHLNMSNQTPATQPTGHDEATGSADVHPDSDWLWVGGFLQVKDRDKMSASAASLADRATQSSQFCIHFPGWSFFPLSPDVITVDQDSPLKFGAHKPPVTWRFKDTELANLTRDLWANASAFSEIPSDVIQELAAVEEDKYFPYKGRNNKSTFVVEGLPDDLRIEKLDKNALIPCLLCKKVIKTRDMRSHVGGHILRAQVGVVEPGLAQKVRTFRSDSCESDQSPYIDIDGQPSLDSSCGFCGLVGCSISLVYQGKKVEMRSTCKYHYDFSYNSALKSTINGPSTNVPVHCPYCPPDPRTANRPALWKYNLDSHIRELHAKDDRAPADRPSSHIAGLKHVSRAEATRLGVNNSVLQAYRQTNDLPGSDDIAHMGIGEEAGGRSGEHDIAHGRKRAGTSTVGGTQLPDWKRAAK